MTDRLDALHTQSVEEPYRGFRCWLDDDVGELMHREAAAASRAVLLATHQPPVIRKVRITEAGQYGADELVGQEELLDTIRTSGEQALIVPIVGVSGSGKSHLVLWLRARLDEENAAHRRIIYLPKGETSLVSVIKRLLDGRTGDVFDRLLHDVDEASRAMGPGEAARRLRDELSLALTKYEAANAGAEIEEYRLYLKANLPALLDDPAYAPRLIGERGPLRRLVEQALQGAREVQAEIAPGDLDVGLTAIEIEPLSAPAKQMLSDLSSAPQLHQVAIEMLNEVRDRCLSQVFGVEPMQLVAVLRRLRQLLYEEDPQLELVLMVEDFSLLQGIQHDLLEAMIELPVREGEQEMCALKTVMAVTEGFFTRMVASNDTLRTRIASQGHVYNLDVQYEAATGALDREAVAAFAGRYLNAVRAGTQTLKDAAPDVPNACVHCEHRERCHDAFGTAAPEQYGLYPFNAAALDRMVRSRQDQFNPRDLLNMLSMTLTTHGQELADGAFPSPAWARSFNPREHNRPSIESLELRVQEAVDATSKPEQRTVLLNFWGAAPKRLQNLNPGIHKAFGIDTVDDVPVAAPVAPSPPERSPQQSSQPEGSEHDRALAVWREGQRLDAERARVIRRVLREAITDTADPEGALWSPQLVDECFGRDTDIEIENSSGQGRAAVGRFTVAFPASNENAILFAGILKMQDRGSWEFDDGSAAMLAFLARVDVAADALRAYMGERLREREADRNAAVALLAFSGLIAGQGGASDEKDLLAAAVTGAPARPSEHMPERWKALIAQCGALHEPCREFVLQGAHVSKDTKKPLGVDGRQFLPRLQTLMADWQIPALSEDAPKPVERLARTLSTRLSDALDEIQETLVAWQDEVVRLVGDPETASDRLRDWRASFAGAQTAGLDAPAPGYRDEGRTLNTLPETLKSVNRILDGWSDLNLGRRIAVVKTVQWGRLPQLRADLLALEKTLTDSIKRARTQQHEATGGGSPIAEFETALDALVDVLSPETNA